MKLSGGFRPNPDVVAFRLGEKLLRLGGAVGKEVRRQATLLVAYVKENKLSDHVLKVQTGRLRRSITMRYAQQGAQYTAWVGTNVRYARAHELGFQGSVSVRAYVVKEHMRKQTTAFGRPLAAPKMVTVQSHSVRSHAMQMNLAKRAFLAPSLEERQDSILKGLRQAIAQELAT